MILSSLPTGTLAGRSNKAFKRERRKVNVGYLGNKWSKKRQ
jgi:hypothetical protein